MPNPPKKIIPNANDSDSFNELKHRQNYCRVRTGAFTCAMVHLVSRATSESAPLPFILSALPNFTWHTTFISLSLLSMQSHRSVKTATCQSVVRRISGRGTPEMDISVYAVQRPGFVFETTFRDTLFCRKQTVSNQPVAPCIGHANLQ